MYSALDAFDFLFAILLFPVWLAAASAVGRLPGCRTVRRMRLVVSVALVLVVLAQLLVIGRIGALVGLVTYDWTFVSDRKIVTIGVLVLVSAIVMATSVTRLRAVRTLAFDEPGQAPLAQHRALASAPWLVAPVKVAALGALPSLFEKFLPPYRMALLNLLGIALILGLLSWLLVARVARKHVQVSGSPPNKRPALRVLAVRLGVVFAFVALVGSLVTVGTLTSQRPDMFDMMQGEMDFGGGESFAQHTHAGSGAGRSTRGGAGGGPATVDQLKGPRTGEPDRRFTLTAQPKQVRLSTGAMVDAWTFNGQVPGPELRMTEGDLVEVILINNLANVPVSVHWHGVDVPNGEDGVAGVTQDAVAPGQTYTYRFRVDEVGTRWYHSHQQAAEQVVRGLFGPMVIEPRQPNRQMDADLAVVMHDWRTVEGALISTIGTSDMLERRRLTPGMRVRLRLINTTNVAKHMTLTGVPYRVTAYDGTELTEPGELTNSMLVVAGGGRYDVEFTMPAAPVRVVDVAHPDAGIAYSPDGLGEVAAVTSGPEFDPLSYGQPATMPFDAGSHFDRHFTMTFDVWLGFYNGSFVQRQTINGRVFPNAPTHMVRAGELIKMTMVNRGEEDHPIHLHGHHFLVLSRDGHRPTGSPIWLDTVNVRPGEIWEIGFRADNPGIWMDHCHNLAHTVLGMVTHLAYENVTSPYTVGGPAHNHPD